MKTEDFAKIGTHPCHDVWKLSARRSMTVADPRDEDTNCVACAAAERHKLGRSVMHQEEFTTRELPALYESECRVSIQRDIVRPRR